MSNTVTALHVPHGEEHPPSLREIVALATRSLLSGEDLDEAVYDAACAHATAINNQGLDVQIEYLLGRFGAQETQRRIERARDLRESSAASEGGVVT